MDIKEQTVKFIWEHPVFQRWDNDYEMEYCFCGTIWRVSSVDEVLNMDGAAHELQASCDEHLRLPIMASAPLGILLRLKTALKHAPIY